MGSNKKSPFTFDDPLGQSRNIPKNWKKFPLYDLAEYVNGMAFSPKDLGTIGHPVIKISELKYGVSITTKYYNGAFDEKYLLKYDDLLFAWSGNPETSIDVFWWFDKPALLNQHIFRVIPKKSVDKNYLFYVLKYLKPTFIRTCREIATSMGHVKIADLKRLTIRLPDKEYQKKIGKILKHFDTQIHLLASQNLLLEKIIQTIFKTWFVTFENYEHFHDSELGRIPKGWRTGKLGRYVSIKGRIGWKGLNISEYSQNGYHLITGNEITNEAIDWDSCPRVSEERYLESPEIMIKKNDILMTKDGSIGRLSFIYNLIQPASIGTGIIILRGTELFDQYFLLEFFKSPQFKNLVNSRIEGTVIPHIYQRDIKELEIVLPPEHIVKEFFKICKPITSLRHSNLQQIDTLEKIRNLLISKLIPGEIQL